MPGGLGDDMLGGLSADGLAGTFTQKAIPMLNKLWFGLRIVIYVGLVGLLAMLVWKFYLRYKAKAIVFMTGGTKVVNIMIDRAYAYEDKDSGVKKITLWRKYNNMRLSIPLLEGKFRYLSGKQDTYILWLDSNMQPQPAELDLSNISSRLAKAGKKAENKIWGGVVDLGMEHFTDEDNVRIAPRPQDRHAWASLERKMQRDKFLKESFLQKYGQVIVPIAVAAISLMLFYFAFKELGAMGTGIGNGLNAIAQNCLR